MAERNEALGSCAVCGRSILPGERISDYIDSDGETAAVCSLCKPRAEASGWIQAALASTQTRHTANRRRTGLNLRERFARVSEAAGSRLARSRPPARETEAASESEPEQRSPAGAWTLAGAVETFNSSREARKVAGLRRSLGPPQVAVHAATGRRTRVTVAWELSWYQWEVSEDGVREVSRGAELGELTERDRDWNAATDEEGALHLG